MPKIAETGDRGKYRVRFEGHDWHEYDTLDPEFPGQGSCSCNDFTIRCANNFRKNGGKVVPYWKEWPMAKGTMAMANPERTVCRHGTAIMYKVYPLTLIIMGGS